MLSNGGVVVFSWENCPEHFRKMAPMYDDVDYVVIGLWANRQEVRDVLDALAGKWKDTFFEKEQPFAVGCVTHA